MKKNFSILFVLILLFTTNTAWSQSAKKKGGGSKALKGGLLSLGIGISFGSIEQAGLNESIKLSKANSAATTDEFKSATEYLAYVTYRLATAPLAVQFRPSIYTQSTHGTGLGGNYDYDLNGYTVFPIVRFIALSNDIIDFYLQGGLGYANIEGSITNAFTRVGFKGSAFGTQLGIGADFCFFPEHCVGVEGSYRYLPIDRNIVTSSSGGLPNGVTNATPNRELENSSFDDIATSLSGVSGIVSYSFNF